MTPRVKIPRASRTDARRASESLDALIARLRELGDFPAAERTPEATRERRKAAQASFVSFALTYLPELIPSVGCPMHEAMGWTLQDLADGKAARPLDPAPYGELVEIEDEAENGEAPDIHAAPIAAPRGHAKSTWGSIAFPTWCVLTARKGYIQQVSDTRDQACGFVEAIRTILEESPRIRADFGEIRIDGGEGTLDIQVPLMLDGTRPGVRLARIQAFGTGQKLRGRNFQGRRPDLVILDDVENDEAVENPARRKKLRMWFTKAVLPALDPTRGAILVLGTILHDASLLWSLLRMFGGAIWRCWDDQERPLWPERFPAKHLRYLRSKMDAEDPGSFAQEMENRAQGDEDKPFRVVQEYEQLPERLLVVTHVDPAGGRRKSDFTALVTVGYANGVCYVLDAVLERLGPTRTGRKILEVREVYRGRIQCEDVAYQESLVEIVDLLVADEGVMLPVTLVRPVGDKVERIKSMAPAIETGKILFPRLSPMARGNSTHAPCLVGGTTGIHRLKEQLLGFPKAANDDGPDALQGATAGRFKRRAFAGISLGLCPGSEGL